MVCISTVCDIGCLFHVVSSQHYRANEAYIVIYMYARVHMQSLTLIDQVVVKIFEVVKRWVAGDVWVRVSIIIIGLKTRMYKRPHLGSWSFTAV
jgi:hypothetical protein